jgi:hypothetical protein
MFGSSRTALFAAPSLTDTPRIVEQSAPPQQQGGAQGPLIGIPVKAIEFKGDVRRLPQPSAPTEPREVPRLRRAPATQPRASTPAEFSDPVAQSHVGIGRAPTPLQNFDGLTFTGWFPPDPNGDVGPNHYIQVVNASQVAIFNKTGTLLASFHYNSLFATAAFPCNTPTRRGDPIVVYDAIANRWLLSDFAYWNSSGPYYQCLAVSMTGDPVSGGWWLYTIQADATQFNDYPKLGVWSDGIYMTADMFVGLSGPFSNVRVWAFNRDDLISGAPLGLRNIYFNLPSSYIHLLPSNLRGALPPAPRPNFLMSVDEPNILRLWKMQVDWSNLLNSSLTGPTNLTVANFTMPCYGASILACVPQLGTSERVDALGDRMMMQLQYRNIGGVESLWVNHTVAAGPDVGYPTGVRWYEIRNPNGVPSVYQQGTFQPDSNYRWMGSLAVDQQGNMALGYSVSSGAMYPAIRYAGRLASDPLGKLCVPETSLIEGTSSQSGGFNRWGDYSAMSVDPSDDLTFWYTNQYYSITGGGWKTRIGSFRIGEPSPGSSGPYIYYFPMVAKSGATPCY